MTKDLETDREPRIQLFSTNLNKLFRTYKTTYQIIRNEFFINVSPIF